MDTKPAQLALIMKMLCWILHINTLQKWPNCLSFRDTTGDGTAVMGAKGLCIPFEQPAPIKEDDKCVGPDCSHTPLKYTLFGRSYWFRYQLLSSAVIDKMLGLHLLNKRIGSHIFICSGIFNVWNKWPSCGVIFSMLFRHIHCIVFNCWGMFYWIVTFVPADL